MASKSKRMKTIEKFIEEQKRVVYTIEQAVETLQQCAPVKFDQSITTSLKVGIDPKKSEQQVRGTVSLPHGTGKTLKVVVIAKADKVPEALKAGADEAGADELIEKIKGGWTDFDILIATPEMMREVGKLGKVLGPRGLMPTPKAGTVTPDVEKAVKEMKGGKVEFKMDKSRVIQNVVGKLSFSKEKVSENIRALLHAVVRAKPASAKGVFMQSLYLASTMGPGLKVDLQELNG
jgi:large subunit ribosomal protein L1